MLFTHISWRLVRLRECRRLHKRARRGRGSGASFLFRYYRARTGGEQRSGSNGLQYPGESVFYWHTVAIRIPGPERFGTVGACKGTVYDQGSRANPDRGCHVETGNKAVLKEHRK